MMDDLTEVERRVLICWLASQGLSDRGLLDLPGLYEAVVRGE